MAKLKRTPISQGDLIAYINTESDFAFEVRVLNALINHGFACEHGGTFEDPVTNKPREFDIRATRQIKRRFVRLAVECKCISDHCPLLVSTLPRRTDEAFHEIVCSVDPDKHPIERLSEPYFSAMLRRSRTIRLSGTHSIYRVGEPVGKSCEQVGREDGGKQQLVSIGDSGVYDKWAQALSSTRDLVDSSRYDGIERTGDAAFSFVVPILVVPDQRLWTVDFDADGRRLNDPVQVDRCSYFVGRTYGYRGVAGGDDVTVSHLEFVTLSGLAALVKAVCDVQHVGKTFPLKQIVRQLSQAREARSS